MTKQPHAVPLRPDYMAAVQAAPNHLFRAAFVSAKAKASGLDARGLFDRLYPQDVVSPVLLTERAASPLGTSTASGWASQLVQTAVGDFLASLAPFSAAAELMKRGLRVQLDDNALGAVNFPARPTGPVVPAWVAEGAAIPVTSAALATVPLGPSKKLGAIVVGSYELFKRSDAATVFATLLRENASRGLDAAYFSTDDGTGTAHEGLLHGAATQAGTAGADTAAMIKDLGWLFDTVMTNGSGEVVIVAANGRAARFWPGAPGMLPANVTMLPSAAVPADVVIAVDPQSLAHGAGSDPDIVTSSEALLHMSDSPLPIVAGATADPVRSLYQTACIAMRMLLPIAFAKRRSDAVAYITGATW